MERIMRDLHIVPPAAAGFCPAPCPATPDGIACGPAARSFPASPVARSGAFNSYRHSGPQRDKRGRVRGAEYGGCMSRAEIERMVGELRALGLDLPEIEYFVRAALVA